MSTDEPVPPCAPISNNDEATATATTAPTVNTVQLLQHSNENLLKVNTFDRNSPAAFLKKKILKDLPDVAKQPPAPLFDGLIRVGKNPSNVYAFFAFETEEQKNRAAEHLVKIVYRHKTWEICPVTENDLNLTHKGGPKREREAAAEAAVKTARTGGEDAGELNVNLWREVPYDEQISRKHAHCLKVMKAIVQNQYTSTWKTQHINLFSGVIRSLELEGYRNHVQLSCGYDKDGDPAVGFLSGGILAGRVAIDPLSEKAVTTHKLVRFYVKKILEVHHLFLERSNGSLCMLHKSSGEGFWRKIQVRHNYTLDTMIDIEINSEGQPAGLVTELKSALVTALTSPECVREAQAELGLPTCRVVSLQCHEHKGTTMASNELPRTILFGVATLWERLCGFMFELAPTAFFQVNTPATELLLNRVVEVAELRKCTTLLDLCCGTGTIGICLSPHVKRVIGIELVEAAVVNAKANAARNNITNIQFHAARVEAVLPDVINTLPSEDKEDIVAILDPPRCGMHKTVLKWLRSTPQIRRIVYISCDQKALENDCPPLTKPASNQYRGMPFKVVSGFGVDLFPQTPHVEMIAVLERTVLTEEEEKQHLLQVQEELKVKESTATPTIVVPQENSGTC